MKNVLGKITAVVTACVLLLSMLPLSVMTVSAAVSGDFEYEVENGQATIIGYSGLATHLTVPSKLGGYPVVSIGDYAFGFCESLESVTIPDSVTTIADYAFSFCSSLTSVTLGNGVKTMGEGVFCFCDSLTAIKVNGDNAAYCDINGVLFTKNKKTLIQYPVGKTASSYTIPDNVTTIGGMAFSGCLSLASVIIGSGVTTIEESAFALCESLTSGLIGKSVTALEEGAFSDCYALANVTIPDSVKVIKEYAFAVCESLTSVTMGNGVTTIGEGAFSDCDSLSDVYYGGSKEEWNAIAIGSWNSDLIAATIHYTNPVVKITAQSATAAYASKDQNASVKVTAKGDGLSYTWYIKNPGSTKYTKSSVTSATYSAKMTAANSGRLLYCIVKDKYGNEVRSKTFVLRMKATITSVPATAAYAAIGQKVSVAIG
ncbi:MAG: leucine-rich repeat domain-containing protein, partial [Clostridia bacterium]|nr:leucine-rich repeat domain-containing protein [Clostridia bacterium]